MTKERLDRMNIMVLRDFAQGISMQTRMNVGGRGRRTKAEVTRELWQEVQKGRADRRTAVERNTQEI